MSLTAPSMDGGLVNPRSAAGGIGVIDVLVIAVAVMIVLMIFRFGWHRLRSPARRYVPFSPPVGIALFAAFLVLAPMGAAVISRVLGIAPAGAAHSLKEQVQLLIGACAAQSLVLIVFVWMHRRSHSASRPNRAMTRKAIMTAVAAFALILPVVLATATAVALAIWLGGGKPPSAVAHDTLRMMIDFPIDGWWVAMALLVTLAAPLFEEVMFRGVLQSVLVSSGVKAWPAIIITSAAFALMHASVADVHALAALFVLSLALGWALEKTGRLTAPIVLHALFNVANLLMGMLLTPAASTT